LDLFLAGAPLRIGLIIYGDLEKRTGGYLYDRMLVQHLRQWGEEILLYSIPWRNYLRHLADNLFLPLEEEILQAQLDLLLQDELNHPSLLRLNDRLGQRLDAPIVSIVHHLRSSEPHAKLINWFYQFIEKRYLAGADGFIFNSQATKAAVEALILEAEPHVVAHPAADHLQFDIHEAQIEQRVTKPGPLEILFIGNLIPRKGLHLLLEALTMVPESVWRLRVIGDEKVRPPYTRKVKRYVRRHRLQNNVTFLGSLPEESLLSQLKGSHIIAVPSLYEGFGIAYLEGMGYGLPALALDRGGQVEFIRHEKNGLLLPEENYLALGDHISSLAEDRRLLLRMSLAARETFESHTTWERSARIAHSFLRDFPRINRR
jgi:glycosyltransferase involved in cell wall biosynthesis